MKLSTKAETSDKEGNDVSAQPEGRHVKVFDSFLEKRSADALRAEFDAVFAANRRELNPKRFMFDNWYVPDQYHMQRTMASDFFSESEYQSLEDALLEFGRNQLGCASMTPVWMSYYTHGNRQELHADVPHGPFAFVLSLTLDQCRQTCFRGGETILLRPHGLITGVGSGRMP